MSEESPKTVPKTRIEIDVFHDIETNLKSVVDKAIAAGLTVTEITKNPNDYKADGSDRPEVIAAKKAKVDQKKAQDKINEEENRPILIKSILENERNKKKETTLKNMKYDLLAEHHDELANYREPIPEIIEEE